MPEKFLIPSLKQNRKSMESDNNDNKECHTRLPNIDDNLIKNSIGMRSELGHLLSCNHTVVDKRDERVKSERPRNRNLHECHKLHTNSRKRDYARWNIPHEVLAQAHIKHQPDLILKWLDEMDKINLVNQHADKRENNSSISSTKYTDPVDGKARSGTNVSNDDEEIDETTRVQYTVETIRKEKEGGILAEIKLIKDRHRQLESLTEMKRKATAVAEKPRTVSPATKECRKREALKKYLLATAHLRKEMQFKLFKEKTTVSLNRTFTEEGTSDEPGLKWKSKWNPSSNRAPGKIHKSIHPAVDAKKLLDKKSFTPLKQGDLPPCVFLPKHIDAKTPIESALMLDQFIRKAKHISEVDLGYARKT